MLSVVTRPIMLSVIMPSVVMPSVVMPSVVMPSVIMPSVVMPSVAMLNVVAPTRPLARKYQTRSKRFFQSVSEEELKF